VKALPVYLKLTHEEKNKLIEELWSTVQQLRDKLSLNSKNSSKPPSTDQDKEKPNPKSQRKKSKKKAGRARRT